MSIPGRAKMRVGIDTTTLRVRHAGIGVYTLELAKALLAEMAQDEALVAFDGLRFTPVEADWPERMHTLNDAQNAATSRNPLNPARALEGLMRAGKVRRRLARAVKEVCFGFGERHFDLFHATAGLPPGRTGKPDIPLVYDVSIQRFPETHPAERIKAYERWTPEIQRAPVINTISDFSRDEIVTMLGIPRERIVVTHPGVDPFFRDSDASGDATALRALDLGDRRLILLVGTLEPRKNIPVALSAFAALPASVRARSVLLIVGGSGWGNLPVPPAAAPLMQNGEIRFSGYVSRQTLRALYRRAALLVFPTLYEGFGIPAAEALTCGTAVAFSAGTSLEEVVGEHGARVASADVDGWALAMRAAVDGDAPSEKQRAARRQWAARYDWRDNARRTLAMYRAVHAGGGLPADLLGP